jgi:hypothetical protein
MWFAWVQVVTAYEYVHSLLGPSAVSQRDLQRFFRLLLFFRNILGHKRDRLQRELAVEEKKATAGGVSKESASLRAQVKSLDDSAINMKATYAALGLAFYLRLMPASRRAFAAKIDSLMDADVQASAEEERVNHDQSLTDDSRSLFVRSFMEMMDYFMSHTLVPSGIARNEALKENVFAIVVGFATKIPVIVRLTSCCSSLSVRA